MRVIYGNGIKGPYYGSLLKSLKSGGELLLPLDEDDDESDWSHSLASWGHAAAHILGNEWDNGK